MSDTPKTDERLIQGMFVEAEFAREAERENKRLEGIAEALRDANQTLSEKIEALERENARFQLDYQGALDANEKLKNELAGLRADLCLPIRILVNENAILRDVAARYEALRAAAIAVVERWDTPLWKDAEPTADVINRLRAAIDAERRKT